MLLGDDNELKSKRLITLAAKHKATGDLQETLRMLPEAERVTNLHPSNLEKGYRLNNIAFLYIAGGNIPEATRVLEEVERISDLLPNDEFPKSNLFLRMSKLYIDIGNLQEATRTLQKAEMAVDLLPNDNEWKQMISDDIAELKLVLYQRIVLI